MKSPSGKVVRLLPRMSLNGAIVARAPVDTQRHQRSGRARALVRVTEQGPMPNTLMVDDRSYAPACGRSKDMRTTVRVNLVLSAGSLF